MAKHTLEKWNHIVDGKIEWVSRKYFPNGHPYEGDKDNEIHIVKLKKYIPNMKYTKKSKKLFYTEFENNISCWTYIRHCGGGGVKKEEYKEKRFSIPGSIDGNIWKRKFKNYENTLLINVYYFLKKEDKEIKVDNNNFVFLIMNPIEIINTLVIKNSNEGSKWIKLSKILEGLESNKLYVTNPKKSVFVVKPENIKKFINKKFIKKFKQFNQIEEKSNNQKQYNYINSFFRDNLLDKRGLKCQWKNCDVKVSELIIASHIKAQRFIKNDTKLSDKDKIKQLIDENNGFLLCKRHDAMFDKHLFTFSKEGKVDLINNKIKKIIKPFCSLEDESDQVIKINKKMHYYLKHHRKECLNKSKEL